MVRRYVGPCLVTPPLHNEEVVARVRGDRRYQAVETLYFAGYRALRV